ncbi:urbain precursor [Bombyx mori]|uniref:urbain precursor n=1 Tax=Bombyx mori TaxID=7091 RepID=UPI001C9601DF|nr:urbain precursor [Bombyx mori]
MTMKLHAALLLTTFVLAARAASIPDKVPEAEDKPLNVVENLSSEQELIDQANTIKDIDNSLRANKKEVVDIPVKVIVEEIKPSLKSDLENVEVPDENEEIKRPLVDLRNPGPPQHQEHETQNPEHHEDAEKIVSSVKNDINTAEIALRQGFQEVSDGIGKWYARTEQINELQASLQHFQENFGAQIQKLNETLHFIKPADTIAAPSVEETQNKASFETIESGLKSLETNFNSGLNQLSEGIQIVATFKADGEAAAESSSTAPAQSTTASTVTSTNGPTNPLIQMVTNLQNSFLSGMANLTQAINNWNSNQAWSVPNIFGGASTAAPQSDVQGDATTTTQRPAPWQNLPSQISNFFNPQGQNSNQQNQSGQQSQAPSGLFSGVQNFPFNFLNLLQPNRPGAQSTEKPAEATSTNGAASAAPDIAKPSESNLPTETKPEQPAAGPLKQIFENSPVLQGIAGAVKKIQTTVNNPVKPRDSEVVEETKSDQEKGGVILLPVHGHGGHGGNGGDNNNVSDGLKAEAEEIKVSTEEKQEEIKEKEIIVENKTE